METLIGEGKIEEVKKKIEGLNEEEVLEGEVQCINIQASYVKNNISYDGRLMMTNYRTIFIPNSNNAFSECRLKRDYFNIPLGFISK